MTEKTLADLIEIILARKRAWNIDTTLKIIIGNTHIGAVTITGKIESIPAEK